MSFGVAAAIMISTKQVRRKDSGTEEEMAEIKPGDQDSKRIGQRNSFERKVIRDESTSTVDVTGISDNEESLQRSNQLPPPSRSNSTIPITLLDQSKSRNKEDSDSEVDVTGVSDSETEELTGANGEFYVSETTGSSRASESVLQSPIPPRVPKTATPSLEHMLKQIDEKMNKYS